MKIKRQKSVNNKYVLCSIVNFLAENGITDNKDISEIGKILTNHDKLRGIKRSNTCIKKGKQLKGKDEVVNIIVNKCIENALSRINRLSNSTYPAWVFSTTMPSPSHEFCDINNCNDLSKNI